MPMQMERATMEATRSSSRCASVAKTTALTAEGIAETSITIARSMPVNSRRITAVRPRRSPPPIRTTTPSRAKGALRPRAAKLIESPSTKLARGVVVR